MAIYTPNKAASIYLRGKKLASIHRGNTCLYRAEEPPVNTPVGEPLVALPDDEEWRTVRTTGVDLPKAGDPRMNLHMYVNAGETIDLSHSFQAWPVDENTLSIAWGDGQTLTRTIKRGIPHGPIGDDSRDYGVLTVPRKTNAPDMFVQEEGSNLCHKYDKAGIYRIQVKGRFKLGNMPRNLKSIELPDGESPIMAVAPYTFANTYLETVPENLLWNCTDTDIFSFLFYMSRLKEIPARLFEKCVCAMMFTGTFAYTYVTQVPDTLFDHNPFAYRFNACFYGILAGSVNQERLMQHAGTGNWDEHPLNPWPGMVDEETGAKYVDWTTWKPGRDAPLTDSFYSSYMRVVAPSQTLTGRVAKAALRINCSSMSGNIYEVGGGTLTQIMEESSYWYFKANVAISSILNFISTDWRHDQFDAVKIVGDEAGEVYYIPIKDLNKYVVILSGGISKSFTVYGVFEPKAIASSSTKISSCYMLDGYRSAIGNVRSGCFVGWDPLLKYDYKYLFNTLCSDIRSLSGLFNGVTVDKVPEQWGIDLAAKFIGELDAGAAGLVRYSFSMMFQNSKTTSVDAGFLRAFSEHISSKYCSEINMSYMFYGCSLSDFVFPDIETRATTINMAGMFSGNKFTSISGCMLTIPAGNNVKTCSMASMFSGNTSLSVVTQNLITFYAGVGNLDLSEMFNGCNIREIPATGIVQMMLYATSGYCNATKMFYGNTGLSVVRPIVHVVNSAYATLFGAIYYTLNVDSFMSSAAIKFDGVTSIATAYYDYTTVSANAAFANVTVDIPADFYKGFLPKDENAFNRTHQNNKTTKALPELWKSHSVATGTDCFTGCENAPNFMDAVAAGWAAEPEIPEEA